MILDFLFLPILFFIGFAASYQDFKEGKIKNKWIVLGLVWGLGVYLLLLIWALIVPYLSQIFSREFTFILPSYVLKVFINSAIALIFGYLLWHFNLWSAGDAKLFFIFSLLLPLKYYWKSALPYFPSFALLINTFIPVLLFLIGQNFFYLLRSISLSEIIDFGRSNLAKLKINYSTYLKIVAGFFLIFMVFQIIRSEVGSLGQWQIALFLLITLARKVLSQFFQKVWILILSFLGIIFYLAVGQIFFFQEPLAKTFLLLKGSLFFMVIFIIVSALLSYIPGREEQKKHLPFAIWLLCGVLITIILKGSLVSFFLNSALFFK